MIVDVYERGVGYLGRYYDMDLEKLRILLWMVWRIKDVEHK